LVDLKPEKTRQIYQAGISRIPKWRRPESKNLEHEHQSQKHRTTAYRELEAFMVNSIPLKGYRYERLPPSEPRSHVRIAGLEILKSRDTTKKPY